MARLKLPRTDTATRLANTPQESEIIFDTDLNSAWLGDGTTAGGLPIGGGSGTVTSVGLTVPGGFTVSGSPITSSGSLSFTTSLTTGLVKPNGSGGFASAVAGTDYQYPITLTTTGTSGVATFAANVLNIPNYSGGSGTVTSVSVVSANGLAGSVATATTTPAITLSTTITGLLKGNGTAISAASAGTDYQAAGNYITALTGDVTASGPGSVAATLANTAVTPGSYTNTNLTVDSKGRITAASNGSGGSGLTVGTTTITSGTTTRVLYDNAGVVGEYTISGTGNVAMTTSPTFVTPALGTPASGTLTSCTGLPISTGVSGLGTGIATALAVNTGSAGAPVLFNGAGGTPSSITLTNATGTAASLTAGTATVASTVSSANEATDTTCFPLFITDSGTQNLQPKNNTGFTFNSNTGQLGVTSMAAYTAAGNIQLAENVSIILDAALSADGTYSGITEAGTAGTTLAFGDLVYLAVADSRWELADADAASTSGDVKLGFCVLAAASDGSATTILLYGKIRADTAFPTLTIGAPAYVSTTAGDIQVAQPSGTDDVIRRVGFANTADELYVNISNDYITHT